MLNFPSFATELKHGVIQVDDFIHHVRILHTDGDYRFNQEFEVTTPKFPCLCLPYITLHKMSFEFVGCFFSLVRFYVIHNDFIPFIVTEKCSREMSLVDS